MRLRHLVSLVVGGLLAAVLAGEAGSAEAGARTCGAASGGYTYAGHQAADRGHGVRATITPAQVRVEAGHVAGWVGVGGPGQGAGGSDAWIQVGIATLEVGDSFLYAEIMRGGKSPQLVVLDDSVAMGESRRVAVLEEVERAGSWRVWVDGRAVTKPVRLEGSSGRWAPIATAESFGGEGAACNAFSFRFEQVSVAQGRGGSWRPLAPGHRFLDGGNRLRSLAPAAEAPPLAFVASS